MIQIRAHTIDTVYYFRHCRYSIVAFCAQFRLFYRIAFGTTLKRYTSTKCNCYFRLLELSDLYILWLNSLSVCVISWFILRLSRTEIKRLNHLIEKLLKTHRFIHFTLYSHKMLFVKSDVWKTWTKAESPIVATHSHLNFKTLNINVLWQYLPLTSAYSLSWYTVQFMKY